MSVEPWIEAWPRSAITPARRRREQRAHERVGGWPGRRRRRARAGRRPGILPRPRVVLTDEPVERPLLDARRILHEAGEDPISVFRILEGVAHDHRRIGVV